MGWTVRGSNPGGGEIFRTHLGQPWGPPSLLFSGQQVPFPWVRWPGHEDNLSPSYSAKVMEKQSYEYMNISATSTCLHYADMDIFTSATYINISEKFH
jgi:hypothetical protein